MGKARAFPLARGFVFATLSALIGCADSALPEAVVVAEHRYISSYASDGEWVYWGAGGSEEESFSLWRAPRDGPAERVADGLSAPLGLILGEGAAYWTTQYGFGACASSLFALSPDDDAPRNLTPEHAGEAGEGMCILGLVKARRDELLLVHRNDLDEPMLLSAEPRGDGPAEIAEVVAPIGEEDGGLRAVARPQPGVFAFLLGNAVVRVTRSGETRHVARGGLRSPAAIAASSAGDIVWADNQFPELPAEVHQEGKGVIAIVEDASVTAMDVVDGDVWVAALRDDSGDGLLLRIGGDDGAVESFEIPYRPRHIIADGGDLLIRATPRREPGEEGFDDPERLLRQPLPP